MQTLTKDELMNVNGGRRYEVVWRKKTAGGYYIYKIQVYNNGHKAGVHYRKVSVDCKKTFDYSLTPYD